MNSELLERYFPKRVKYLDYSQVAIIPGHSQITTRSSVKTDGSFRQFYTHTSMMSWDVPIIPANMDSIVGVELVKNTINAGGIASLHRFSILEQLETDLLALSTVSKYRLFGSVGLLTRDIEQRRAMMLYRHGIRCFMIDIAHGHTEDMAKSIKWLRQKFGDVLVAAGNVGTAVAVEFLYQAGADMVKVGIAGGKVCRTRNVTGVYTPMLSTVLECCNLDCVRDGHVQIIADGGIREYGDVAKAIGAGASLVMAGYLFAGCTDANMPTIYRGMASNEVAYSAYELGLRDDKPTAAAEGVQITVADAKKSSADVVQELGAALRSSYSYVGANNTREFQELVSFIEIDSNQR